MNLTTLGITLLIGVPLGGIVGIVIGVIISDRWWRKNVSKYSHLIPPAYAQTEYKKGSKNDDK